MHPHTTLLAGCVFGLWACASNKAVVDPDLASHAIKMSLRPSTQQSANTDSFAFGNYQIRAFQQQPLERIRTEHDETQRQRYTFELTDVQGTRWQAECQSNQAIKHADESRSFRLQCVLYDVELRTPYRLTLMRHGFQSDTGFGEITGDTSLQIEVLYADESAEARPLGFDFILLGRPVGAMHLTEDPTLWVDYQLGTTLQSLVAVSAAGLYFFHTLSPS